MPAGYKTGKFVIENKETYLPDVVAEEVDQLIETAKAHELQLIYKNLVTSQRSILMKTRSVRLL